MPYYTRSYNPYAGVTDPLFAIPRVQEVNQKDAELAFNEREMASYLAAEAARNSNPVLDRNAAARQKYAAMVERNKRLNQDPTFQPGVGIPQPITSVTEIGPGGYQPPKPLPPLSTMEVSAPTYQPGYQGGLDFANPEDMVLPPPRTKASAITDAALDAGQRIARDQGLMSQAREGVSSFFGGVGDFLTSPVMERILAIMARPEFQDPEGIAAGVAGAAYGIKQDELKAQKAQREEQRLANEAAQQQFLNRLKIAEARRGEERLRLAQEEAAKVTPKPIEATKEQIKLTTSLLDDVPIAKQYIDNQSGILGIGKDRIKRSIVMEALSIRAQSGNQLNIRQAVEKAIQNRTGATPQDTAAIQSARPGVKERD